MTYVLRPDKNEEESKFYFIFLYIERLREKEKEKGNSLYFNFLFHIVFGETDEGEDAKEFTQTQQAAPPNSFVRITYIYILIMCFILNG